MLRMSCDVSQDSEEVLELLLILRVWAPLLEASLPQANAHRSKGFAHSCEALACKERKRLGNALQRPAVWDGFFLYFKAFWVGAGGEAVLRN